MLTRLQELLIEELTERGESIEDIEASTTPFDDIDETSMPLVVWTAKFIYLSASFFTFNVIESIPRHPGEVLKR